MPPRFLSTSDISAAAQILRGGGLVAMPTETVYGLAADACNPSAVAAIYSAKARPSNNPLIIHVSSIDMAQRYVQWNATAQRLADAFWPGPLTMVLPQVPACPLAPAVTAGLPTAAIRVPAHPVAQALIAEFGGALAAPSANRSGRVSPTTAEHVATEFPDLAVPILTAPALEVGIESTIVEVNDDGVYMLRPGSITQAQIEALGIAVRTKETAEILLAPGMMQSHYAPTCAVRLNATDVEADEALLRFGPAPVSGSPACERALSLSGDLLEAAQNLFSCLRALDKPGIRAIAVMPIPNSGVGVAINDRLHRAAAPRPTQED